MERIVNPIDIIGVCLEELLEKSFLVVKSTKKEDYDKKKEIIEGIVQLVEKEQSVWGSVILINKKEFKHKTNLIKGSIQRYKEQYNELNMKKLKPLIENTTEEFNYLVDILRDTYNKNGEIYLEDIVEQVNILGDSIKLIAMEQKKINPTEVFRL